MTARSRRGFTFVELMLVLTIIGVLATIAIPLLQGMRERAHDGVVLSDFRRAWQAIEMHYVSTLEYPATAAAADFEPSTGVTFHTWDIRPYLGKPAMFLAAHHESSAFQFQNDGYPTSTEIEKVPYSPPVLSSDFWRSEGTGSGWRLSAAAVILGDRLEI